MKTENRGGARTSLNKKIGRPKSEPTQPFYCRIPISVYSELSDYVHKYVEAHKTKSSLK